MIGEAVGTQEEDEDAPSVVTRFSTLEPRRVIYAQHTRGVVFQSYTFTDFLRALWYRRNRKTAYECLTFAVDLRAITS